NPEVIAEEITNKLHRGVTLSKGVGYYTGEEHEILVCVVRKKQVNLVKNIVAAADPNAFLYITKAREVTGKGFTTKL
ncbi:MAG: YitT family protein, partial [Clostridia bacterium]